MVCPLLWCVKRALSPVKDSQRRRIYEESKGLIVLPTKTVNGIVGALLGKALMLPYVFGGAVIVLAAEPKLRYFSLACESKMAKP